MSIKDLTITDQTVQGIYVQSQPDRLTGTAQQNKAVFDAYPALIKQRFNELIALLTDAGAAGEIPVGPIEGVTAENVQQALAAIKQNLTAYINKLKATTGAAEVGVSTIRGMQAQNVQKALEELRKAIDDSVSGIIPGGSITEDMLAGPIPPEKGGTGAVNSQNALAALGAGVRPNLLRNACFVGGGSQQGGGQFPINQRGKLSYTGAEYGIDGWKGMFGSEKVTLESNNLSLTFSNNQGIQQIFDAGIINEIKGKIVTQSILWKLSSGSFASAGLYVDEQAILPPSLSTVGDKWVLTEITTQISDNITSAHFDISGDGNIKVAAAKVEIGSSQSLAYQNTSGEWKMLPQSEGYQIQLADCKRLLLMGPMYGPCIFYNGFGAGFMIPTPVKFRNTPVILGNPTINNYDGTKRNDATFRGAYVKSNSIYVYYEFSSPPASFNGCIEFPEESGLSAEL